MAHVVLKKPKKKGHELGLPIYNSDRETEIQTIIEKRLEDVKSSKSIDELCQQIFLPKLDTVKQSQPQKRNLVSDWITNYINNSLDNAQLKYSSLDDLIDSIYPKLWNEEDGYYPRLRIVIKEWIENAARKSLY